MKRWKWIITGGVQGVGFRPFVYKSALGAAVSGHVGNTSEGVIIEVQGSDAHLTAFENLFAANLPPLARVVGWERAVMEPVAGETGFVIRESTGGAGHQVLISPDVATCTDCLRDIEDPAGRRHRYPFTNCTNCGPRYTITRSIPYDRATTSMACFPMCPACRNEYTDPLDRRFHAQPNACPVCGPKVWLADREGTRLAEGEEALAETARLLRDGRILAMKGLGGFHLACDARDAMAVAALRQRKKRKDKPLAVMVRDLDAAHALAHVGRDEAALLAGVERPIVLVPSKPEAGLAPDLSPDTGYLGLMLPYTPLHHVLLALLAETGMPAALVMTSGNASADPICLGNREALARLAGIADFFLFHDRDILIRCDDSVLRWTCEAPQFIRRARGFTPSPIDLATDGPTVLGVGPLLKNTLCLTKGRQAFVSQHIGDLENLGTFTFFREIAAHLADILQVRPEVVVHDLHPDYMSTTFARESGLPCLALQHHFAHVRAVLAENRHQGPALGLALDGTGLGDDGTIWGGEALFVDTTSLEQRRLARFAQVRLPGGDSAAREPWRMARACLHALGVNAPTAKPWPWLERFGAADNIVGQMLDRGLNSPLSSSCGRLFDAVAGMLGLCLDSSYEGQAAILLEAAQDKTETSAYVCPIVDREGPHELDTLTLFTQVHADWLAGETAERISRRFHLGLMDGLTALCATLARETGCSHVGLSGGVMHNLTLATELPRRLREQGLTALTHRQLPPNDACISLGQAAYGRVASTFNRSKTCVS